MKKKLKLVDQVEELDAMGQESEIKAAKWVMEKGKQDAQQEQDEQNMVKELLESKRKRENVYKEELLKEVFRRIHTVELPVGYFMGAFYTQKGLVVWVFTPKRRWFAKGMQVSGEVKYDMNGIDRVLVRACDFVDELVDQSNKTEGGIYLK